MDSESRKLWQLDNLGPDLLSWKKFGKFLNTLSRALEAGNAKPNVPSTRATNAQPTDKPIQAYYAPITSCEICQDSQKLYACPQLKQLPLAERHNLVKVKKL